MPPPGGGVTPPLGRVVPAAAGSCAQSPTVTLSVKDRDVTHGRVFLRDCPVLPVLRCSYREPQPCRSWQAVWSLVHHLKERGRGRLCPMRAGAVLILPVPCLTLQCERGAWSGNEGAWLGSPYGKGGYPDFHQHSHFLRSC